MVDVFDRMFKCALTFGMSSAEFWFGDPQDYFVYQDAFAEKQKTLHDTIDVLSWNIAVYELQAHRQALSESLGGKRKKIFPEQPISCTKQKETKKKDDSVHPLLNKFLTMANAVNRNFKDEKNG